MAYYNIKIPINNVICKKYWALFHHTLHPKPLQLLNQKSINRHLPFSRVKSE